MLNWLNALVNGWPKYCLECGKELKEYIERGAGRFNNEEWTTLECPERRALGKDYKDHYSEIIKSRPYPIKYDPYTGKPINEKPA